jgi:hypothetical protein
MEASTPTSPASRPHGKHTAKVVAAAAAAAAAAAGIGLVGSQDDRFTAPEEPSTEFQLLLQRPCNTTKKMLLPLQAFIIMHHHQSLKYL